METDAAAHEGPVGRHGGRAAKAWCKGEMGVRAARAKVPKKPVKRGPRSQCLGFRLSYDPQEYRRGGTRTTTVHVLLISTTRREPQQQNADTEDKEEQRGVEREEL